MTKRWSTQEERNRNIEVLGLPNIADRNLKSYIEGIAEKIDFDLLENDIESITQYRPHSNTTHFTVIITMKTKQRKNDFLKSLLSKKNVLKKAYHNPSLQFFDHLTAETKERLTKAKIIAKENDFCVWLEDGRIYAQKNLNSEKFQISMDRDLKKMKQLIGSVDKEQGYSGNSNELTNDNNNDDSDDGNQNDNKDLKQNDGSYTNDNDDRSWDDSDYDENPLIYGQGCANAGTTKNVAENNATATGNITKATKKENKLITQEDLMRDIEVFGLPEEAHKDIKSYIEELAKKVKFYLEEDDIECIKRGPSRRDNQLSNFIITMKTIESKEVFIKKNNKYNSMCGGCIRFHDHLTKENKKLLWETRLAAKQLKFQSVWTKNGEIFTRQSKETEALHIKDLKDIENKMHKLKIVS